MLKFAHDIAGGQGNLIIVSFQSPDFEAGVTGWQVTKAGDAEFNNIIARGVIDATEFSATVVVSAGAYAGVYTIETGEYTDSDDNQLAVIQWLNGSSAAVIPPYLAAVNGEGAGAIASLHSGQQDSGDSDASIWVESAEASSTGQSLILFVAATWQPFGATGPTVFQVGSAWAVDDWHTIELDAGWTVESGHQAPSYRLLPDGNLQFAGAATHASMTSVTPLNSSNPLDSDYFPGHVKVYRGANPVDGTGPIEYDTTGVLRVRASAADAYTIAEIDGIASLL
jgi:hypothetical protein